MWEILLSNAGWDCFKTPILQEILRVRNPLLEEHCASLEVIRMFSQVGCVRNFSVALFNRIRNHPSGRWIEIRRVSHSRLVGSDRRSFSRKKYQSNQGRRDLCTNVREVRAVPHTLQKRKKSHGMIDDVDNVAFIFSNRMGTTR